MILFVLDLPRLEAVGCYVGMSGHLALTFSTMFVTEREVNVPHATGHLVDWINYEKYLPQLLSRCVDIAKRYNFTIFGVMNYG